jgi:hypothetical protein
MNCKRCGRPIEEHEAGRKTDACIAEVVMGRKIQYIKRDPGAAFGGAVFTIDRTWLVDDWFDIDVRRRVDGYSTSWASIGPLLARLRELGMDCEIHMYHNPLEGTKEIYFVIAYRKGRYWQTLRINAEAFPLALCRAALEAVSLMDADENEMTKCCETCKWSTGWTDWGTDCPCWEAKG